MGCPVIVRQFARERKPQGNRVICHFLRAVVLHVGDQNPLLGCCVDINNVHTNAVARNDLAFLHLQNCLATNSSVLVHHGRAVWRHIKQIFLMLDLKGYDLSTRRFQNFRLNTDVAKVVIGNHDLGSIRSRSELGALSHMHQPNKLIRMSGYRVQKCCQTGLPYRPCDKAFRQGSTCAPASCAACHQGFQ